MKKEVDDAYWEEYLKIDEEMWNEMMNAINDIGEFSRVLEKYNQQFCELKKRYEENN